MDILLSIMVLWPVVMFLISLALPEKSEHLISVFSFAAVGVHHVALLSWIIFWIWNGSRSINVNELTLFKGNHVNFYIDFLYNKVTAVYSYIGSLLTVMILAYSRVYMHREEGYKRFFNTLLLFYAGFILTVFAGNLETLFIGWEVLGITSFLLVAYYRDRYLPVKNAYKVFSIYRIGDVGIILAIWASHHLWHDNITFLKLYDETWLADNMAGHQLLALFVSVMILIAAAAKSAQFPFTSWLPRAMEGPTPSSAIYYGALSVHIGLLLLLRTMPIWEHHLVSRLLIGGAGLMTALVATVNSRVQSSVKSQIAYASAAQIGIMFVELALGWENLVLIHFAGNAFLRTYQLLVTPSAVSYLIREQFYNFQPAPNTFENSFAKRIRYSLYVTGLKEFYMDEILDSLLWKPFKKLGNLLRFINIRNIFFVTIPLLILSIVVKLLSYKLPAFINDFLPEIMALIGLLLVFRAYAGRRNVFVVWTLLLMNHFWVLIAVSYNESLILKEMFFYLSGVLLSGIAGYLILIRLKSMEKDLDLNRYQGHVFEYKALAMAFLLSCLGLAAFPISPTFIGVDIIFSHIEYDQFFLAFYLSLGFVVSGIALIRMYSRIFLGPHIKSYHEKALKSG